jgi:hypothetical protein
MKTFKMEVPELTPAKAGAGMTDFLRKHQVSDFLIPEP